MSQMAREKLTLRAVGQTVPALRPSLTTALTTGSGAAVHSPVVGELTSVVRVATTTLARVAIGPDADATTGDLILPAGSVEYFRVQPGDRVSLLSPSGAGLATVTEC